MNPTTRASICDPQQQQQLQQFMTVEGVVLRPCGLSCRPTDQGGPHAVPSFAVTLKKEGITLMSDDIKEKGAQLCLEYFHFVVPQEVLYLFYFNNRVWAESICGS